MTQMGGEVVDPRRSIPRACILTCLLTAVAFLLTYVAVVGALPWYGPQGFVATQSTHIMATFAEALLGRPFAIGSTFIVVVVIWSSVLSMIVGMQFLPGAAAEDGLFFKV